MAPAHAEPSTVHSGTAPLQDSSSPTSDPLAGPPYDSSPVVILAAVLGSLVFAVAFFWFARCAFADPLLRQIRTRDQAPGYYFSCLLPRT
ncbi:hypothetical protein L209DRAFT_389374 [Thermothelomyces heterothallicus CBS 203.75]